MAFSYVQQANASTTAGGTSLGAAAFSATTGNHLFVHVRWEVTATTVAITDTAGNTYTALTATPSSQGAYSQWFYCLNAAGNAANVVTATWSSSMVYRSVRVMEFASSSAVYEQLVNNTATASMSVSATYNTASAGLVLVGVAAYNGDTSTTFSAGYTALANAFDYSKEAYQITTGALTSETVTHSSAISTSRSMDVLTLTLGASGTAVNPAVGTLALTGYAPTLAQTRNQFIAPGVGSLAITGYAPTIRQPQAIAPDVGTLTLTGYAPTITQAANQDIRPGVGSLALSGYAPTVAQTRNVSVDPATGALTLTGYAPSIAQTANHAIAPDVGSLTLTGYAPTVVQASASISIAPGVGVLTITGYAPEVAQTGAAAGDYPAKKRKYVIRKDGKLLVFTDPELAKRVLHQDDEPEPIKQQPAKKQKKAAPQQIEVSAPPEQVVDLAEIKALAEKHQAEQEYSRLLAQQQYETLLSLLERLQEDEEDDWLLMAAA